MDQDFKPPEYLSFQGNPSENWRVWKQRWELYIDAREAGGKSDGTKIAMLLSALGPEALERFNHFAWTVDGDEKVYSKVMDMFQTELTGLKRVVFSRYKFWEYNRTEAQPFEEYLNQLRILAKECEFLEKDNMIRDKIVFSTKTKALKERLLREKDLTLLKAIDLCKSAEITEKEMRSMRSMGSNEADIQAINRSQNPVQNPRRNPRFDKHNQNGSSQQDCGRCGRSHSPKQCFAWNKTCRKCQGLHHFAQFCKSKRVAKVHYLSQDESDSDDEFFIDHLYVGDIHSIVDKTDAWYAIISINGSRIKMKLDTGAAANVLPWKTLNKLKIKPKMSVSDTKLRAYGGHEVKHAGKVKLTCGVDGKDGAFEFFVASSKSVPILGLKACVALGLVKKGSECVIDGYLKESVDSVDSETTPSTTGKPLTVESTTVEYKDVFTGIGKFKDPYNITLKEDANPVIHPPRRVPFGLYDRLKDKLSTMEKDEIISKVDQPTDWVSSLVVVEKSDNSLRLCLDTVHMNKAIRREHFHIPTFDEVIGRLENKKVFTIFDQKDSYHQIQLTEESSYLCTFNTPFGRYKFNRLPFGLISSSDVLQNRTYKAFGDIPGVFLIADDMILATETEEENDILIRKVLDRARSEGVKFNKNKIQLKQSTVVYMGRILGKDGLRPCPKKIQSILDMPNPTDKEGVRRFLGMVQFLSPFIPNMSTVTAPLRATLKKNIQWQWLPEHEIAMSKLKEILSSNPVLRLYDPKIPIKIQADSSSTGLGACMLQENQPVAYASRALTDPETRWSQIEKELLAICFAAEQFKHYIYNCEVEVESDHSPLQQIHTKSIHKASPRLQLMLLKLLRYNLHIKYVKGSKMYIADTLSRAYIEGDQSSPFENARIHSVTATVKVSGEKLVSIRESTESDPMLQKLKGYIYNGWPLHRSSIPYELQPFWQFRGQLHEENGVLFVCERVVIPSDLIGEMLNKIHEGHLGMDKCKARAREIIYWPSMDKDIELKVATCATCSTYKPKNVKEPLMPHPIPDRPWEKLGADIFEFGGKNYLVVVDYHSKYPEVAKLDNKGANGVIKVLKQIMCRHGIPDTLCADNMPFNSYEIHKWAKEWGFKIITSSPLYSQSNGQAEKFVGIVKAMLRKAHHEGKDPQLALLQYRNTPITGLKYSPAQLLMSRRLKDKLPSKHSLLMPQVVQNVKLDLGNRQDKQKYFYDKSAKHRMPHNIGDNVTVQMGKQWIPAVITGKHDSPRSYLVNTADGGNYRRNSRFINRSVETSLPFIPDQGVAIPNHMASSPQNASGNDVSYPGETPCTTPLVVPSPQGISPPNPNDNIPFVTPPKDISPPRRSDRDRRAPVKLKDYHVYGSKATMGK